MRCNTDLEDLCSHSDEQNIFLFYVSLSRVTKVSLVTLMRMWAGHQENQPCDQRVGTSVPPLTSGEGRGTGGSINGQCFHH